MGGRGGRGGGRGMSFTLEQMGLTRGEALPAPVATPPPHYPMLEHYPAVMAPAPRHYAMLAYRANLLKHLTIYSERLQVPGSENGPHTIDKKDTTPSEQLNLNFLWPHFPMELRPTSNRKRKSSSDNRSHRGKVQKAKNFEAL